MSSSCQFPWAWPRKVSAYLDACESSSSCYGNLVEVWESDWGFCRQDGCVRHDALAGHEDLRKMSAKLLATWAATDSVRDAA
jgi:hypothetical protein